MEWNTISLPWRGFFFKGRAETEPTLQEREECWFLPIFGVHSPKNPNQILMVFDSSATFQNHSLNSALLSCPDLTNSLHGILLRIRTGKYVVTGDIQQMFHSLKSANTINTLYASSGKKTMIQHYP